MLEMQTSRTEAQKIYTVVHNVEAVTVTTGMAMRYCGGAAEIVSTDGISAVKMTADADGYNMAGIAVKDIPADDYGRVQCWGYVNSVLISAIANSTSAPGTLLRASSVAGALEGVTGITGQALSTMGYNYIEQMVTTNVSGGLNYGSGFIRAI
jgi:hypothetical protein